MAGFVAAGVADGLLAFAVAPAGAVGDQLSVVAGEEVADEDSYVKCQVVTRDSRDGGGRAETAGCATFWLQIGVL